MAATTSIKPTTQLKSSVAQRTSKINSPYTGNSSSDQLGNALYLFSFLGTKSGQDSLRNEGYQLSSVAKQANDAIEKASLKDLSNYSGMPALDFYKKSADQFNKQFNITPNKSFGFSNDQTPYAQKLYLADEINYGRSTADQADKQLKEWFSVSSQPVYTPPSNVTTSPFKSTNNATNIGSTVKPVPLPSAVASALYDKDYAPNARTIEYDNKLIQGSGRDTMNYKPTAPVVPQTSEQTPATNLPSKPTSPVSEKDIANTQSIVEKALPKVQSQIGEGGASITPLKTIYALTPGNQASGGTTSVITSPNLVTSYVKSTKLGPEISAVPSTSSIATPESAINITPIVNYKTAPEGAPAFINEILKENALKLQKSITGQLIDNIYNKRSDQITRPEYTLNEKGITVVTPVQEGFKPPTAQQQEEGLKKFGEQEIDKKTKEAEEKLRLEKEAKQKELDEQAKRNAEIEAKRRADAKAAEAERLRLQNQFDYDSAIEAALRAAEGNSALARKQFSAYEDRQKTMDAEKLAQQRAKRVNPAGYAGGFAQKAIQPTPATPAAIKAPAMKAPQPSAPIEPTANKVSSSFLPPKVDGLQFGGT